MKPKRPSKKTVASIVADISKLALRLPRQEGFIDDAIADFIDGFDRFMDKHGTTLNGWISAGNRQDIYAILDRTNTQDEVSVANEILSNISDSTVIKALDNDYVHCEFFVVPVLGVFDHKSHLTGKALEEFAKSFRKHDMLDDTQSVILLPELFHPEQIKTDYFERNQTLNNILNNLNKNGFMAYDGPALFHQQEDQDNPIEENDETIPVLALRYLIGVTIGGKLDIYEEGSLLEWKEDMTALLNEYWGEGLAVCEPNSLHEGFREGVNAYNYIALSVFLGTLEDKGAERCEFEVSPEVCEGMRLIISVKSSTSNKGMAWNLDEFDSDRVIERDVDYIQWKISNHIMEQNLKKWTPEKSALRN